MWTWSQSLPDNNLKVHQLSTLGVVDAFYVDVGADEGCVDAFHVEEEKSRLRSVGLDGFGGKLRRLDLVAFFLGNGALHFFLRDGKGQRSVSVGAGIGDAAVDIVWRGRGELIAVGGGERDLHVGDRDGLRAVVGDDEEDGKEPVLVKLHGKYFRFAGSVVGVGGDGNFFVGVIVMRGIGLRGLRLRLDEVFSRQR